MAALKRALNMRLTAAMDVDIVALVLLSLCYNNSVTSVRKWLMIFNVDNDVIESWVSTSSTCTAANWPSRQKRGDTMFHVEGGNGYLYPQMGM